MSFVVQYMHEHLCLSNNYTNKDILTQAQAQNNARKGKPKRKAYMYIRGRRGLDDN